MTVPNFNHVALFVQTIRAGSFTAASRQSGIPANTISRRIQQLEAALDTRLLHRSTRKLSLTAAGQEFYERCCRNLDELVDACIQASQSSQMACGTLRIAASVDFFDFVPMERVRRFMSEYPLVRLEFILSDSDADLVGDAVDIAIRAGHMESSSLVAHRLAGSYHVLVASPAYLEAHGEPQNPEALAQHTGITRPRQMEWSLSGSGGTVTVPVQAVLSTNTMGSRLAAAIAGIGIALLPIELVARPLATGMLIRLLSDCRFERTGVYLVYPSRRQRSAAVSAFAEFMMQTTATEPPLQRHVGSQEHGQPAFIQKL